MAQEDEELIDPVLIQLKGVLISKYDGLPVPFATVVNLRTHGGTTTNAEGRFSIQMLNIDSLSISAIGFTKDKIGIPPRQHEDSLFIAYAYPVRYLIKEVEVVGQGKSIDLGFTGRPVNIDPELRGDAFNEKPPWYASVISPASFLQYHLSKKEKGKRKIRAAMVAEREWEQLSQLYNIRMVTEITGLTDDEADKFMIWFNSKSLLDAASNEYDVRVAITNQYKIYKEEQNESQQ